MFKRYLYKTSDNLKNNLKRWLKWIFIIFLVCISILSFIGALAIKSVSQVVNLDNLSKLEQAGKIYKDESLLTQYIPYYHYTEWFLKNSQLVTMIAIITCFTSIIILVIFLKSTKKKT